MAIRKPLVVGMGRVGSLIALLLGELGMQVAGVDTKTTPSVPAHIDFTSADISACCSSMRWPLAPRVFGAPLDTTAASLPRVPNRALALATPGLSG